jgi:uracil-DNA glycosylase family 4
MMQQILTALEIYPWVRRATPSLIVIELIADQSEETLSGALFTNLLFAVQLKRDDLYCLSLPAMNETHINQSLINQAIQTIQPASIVVLGEAAAQYILNTHAPLHALRNQQQAYATSNIPLYVSFHPSELIKNPIEKKQAYLDWLMIMGQRH